MADNTVLNTGSGGDTIASDDILGVKHQRVKVQYGADGSATDVDSINRLPVGGSELAAIQTSVEIIDNAIAGTEMQVDVVAPLPTGTNSIGIVGLDAGSNSIGAVTVNANGGGVEAGALRVTLASDSSGLVSVDDNGGSLTVDNAQLSVVGGGTEAAAMRVTLANDSTGLLSVDDNGGSLTVDNAGTFATQSEGDIAHDAADSGNPVKIGGKAKNFDGTPPGTAVAENDRADVITDVYGRVFVESAHPNHWSASTDYSVAQTNATVKASPGVGLKLYITDVIISNGATAGNITLLDGSGGTVLLEAYPAVNGGLCKEFKTPITLTADTLLAITSTTVTTHSITVSGYVAP